MKIAIGKDGNQVSGFFGSCNDFRIVTVEDNKVVASQDVFDDVHTHKARPEFLRSLGVDVLVMNGMGQTAYVLLREQGIELFSALDCTIDQALEKYIANQLESLGEPGGAHCN